MDKKTGYYTVGPYILKCQYGKPDTQKILYNEIIGKEESDGGNKFYSEETKFAVFNGIDKTLTQDEVMEVFNKIVDQVENNYNAILRDK